jgi:predicted sulfurtransferase
MIVKQVVTFPFYPQNGFEKAAHLKGGFLAWLAHNTNNN